MRRLHHGGRIPLLVMLVAFRARNYFVTVAELRTLM
jgi:hypothetical protein